MAAPFLHVDEAATHAEHLERDLELIFQLMYFLKQPYSDVVQMSDHTKTWLIGRLRKQASEEGRWLCSVSEFGRK